MTNVLVNTLNRFRVKRIRIGLRYCCQYFVRPYCNILIVFSITRRLLWKHGSTCYVIGCL